MSTFGSKNDPATYSILFIDIVAYSELKMENQVRAIERLTDVVRDSDVVRNTRSKDRIFLPTGDGMAIGFRALPAKPLALARHIHEAYSGDRRTLKMGIHEGIVFHIKDINGNLNFAGSGINMAARTLSCCGKGHVLVSRNLAEQLRESEEWSALLHGPYDFLVKHDRCLTAYSLYDESGAVGNPDESFHNLVSIPDYVSLRTLLAKKLGVSAGENWQATDFEALGVPDPLVFDDALLESPIAGFQGVDESKLVVSAAPTGPNLPECVYSKKDAIPKPGDNRSKAFLAGWTPPISDKGRRLKLSIGASDFWTYEAVRKSAAETHALFRLGKKTLKEFPRKLNCHIVLITGDNKLVLCRRGGKDVVDFQYFRWSASLEEGMDGERDVNRDGIIDPRQTVRRALSRKDELDIPNDALASGQIKFLAIATEWHLTLPLITLVRLPSVSLEQVVDCWRGAHDLGEHTAVDGIEFALKECCALLRRNCHVLPNSRDGESPLHSTSRLRIFAALCSEYGYSNVLEHIRTLDDLTK